MSAVEQFESQDSRLELVNFTGSETPVTRDFGGSGFSQSFPTNKTVQILDNFNKAAVAAEKAREDDTKKCRNLAMKIISNKKTAIKILELINKNALPLVSSVNSLIAIAQALEPGEPVTADRLADVIDGRPNDINKKQWADAFLPLVDFAGFTIKENDTRRRFAEYSELLCKCNPLANCVLKSTDIAFRVSDQLAGRLIRVDPYTERLKNGEVIRHEKPHQTQEGKALAREVAQARYEAEMTKKKRQYENSIDVGEFGNNVGTNRLSEFANNKPMLAISILTVVLLIGAAAEFNSKKKVDMNPQLANTPTFDAAAVAAQAGN